MQELGKNGIQLGKTFVEANQQSLSSFPLPMFFRSFVSTPVPSSPIRLLAHQQDSNILLTWEEIPLANRRGFLLGYNVYVSNDSHLTLIGTCLDAYSIWLYSLFASVKHATLIVEIKHNLSKMLQASG